MPAAVLPVDLRSAASARALLRDSLRDHGRDGSGSDDALVMISELVTNAVRHTDALLHVRITIDGRTLRVDVTDDDPTLPTASAPDDDRTSGRGLLIVDRLADAWGVTPTPSGKTIWFEVALDRSGPPTAAST